MNPILCPGEIPHFLKLFDLSTAPSLLFYTYIPAIILSLFLGFFVLRKAKKNLESKLLFLITLFFSLWVLDILVLWVASYNDALLFGWQITPIFEFPLFIFSIYFTLVMTNKEKKDISSYLKLFFIGLMTFVFVLLPTHLNIVNYNISNCEGTPGFLFYFMYGWEVMAIIALIIICIKRFRSLPKTDVFRKEVLWVGISIVSFLVLFNGSNIIGQITEIQEISFIGSLGMVLFLGVLVYIIVRFKTFNVKLVAAQALVWALILLIGSQFFFIKVPINFVLTGITFVAVIIFGQLLIKSVKKEIEQREHIEQLATQRESFIHFLSHEVKGILGKNKNMFAMILEKDSVTTPEQVESFVKRSAVDTDGAIEMVENILHSNDFKNGKMNMDMNPFDLKIATLEAIESLKLDIETKKLFLETKIDESQNYTVIGDKENITKHVIRNLIDNAIRYTPKGIVNVSLSKKDGKILFSVKDTGVGITQEDMAKLFTEGGHGKDSIKVNVHSTGYGLFFAKGIVDAHHGRIWAESEGTGKGTTFFLELPVNSI